ncbi:hypothetical protein BDQ94DRAFT_181723 [Aspergillus welwitschiae]|uniref:C2H2-type domain-containing protein n=1 Tax=Aspergillus welwitschiae TaxID=1341132 RepID=A0A3F3PT98_9EURO|nr:hypothetical protein BDQ94DRAFT_181723 [Aspergillus welwitschiae]RDH30144.1 hypothetical protein BDQ94DRAFT_181723 [Aspergillus welwitschiae]
MMDPLGNRVTGHRRALKCTYCARSFARTEHLTRHERSHRNEKPFSCNYCSATFTRKDVIKRHHLRYHPTIPEPVGATTASRVLDSSQLAPLAINSPQEPILHCSEDVGSADTAPNNDGNSPGLFMDNYTLDAILADFDFQPAPNVEFTSNLPGTVTSSRIPAQARDQLSWRGSLELSEKKRMQVYTEAESVLKSAGIKHIGDFPSRLRLERFLVAFFEFFLDYHPFLHVPTWRAEEAHSCLLLAMLVIGAGCYKDYDMAHALYCAGRHSVMTHRRSTTFPQRSVVDISSSKCMIDPATYHGIYHRDWEHESEELWEDWVNNEMALRTKWAAFTALNVLTVCFHVPPTLLVHEMSNVPLPCKEPEWASPTMESWLRARLARIQSRPCLGDALAALLSPSPLPTDAVSVFGTYVLLHAVLQKAWEFRQNIWLESAELTKYLEKFELTLRRWHTCWEGNVESSVSPRNPYIDFTPVRTAIASHSSETIELSFKQLVIPISQSDLTMRIVAHAIGALSTRVKLGMALPEQRLSCFQSFEVHLFSIECCLFSYHWLKETQNRLELEWSPEETARIKQVREILSEVDLPAIHAQKSDAVRLIYAWALILSRRAVWKLQKIPPALMTLSGRVVVVTGASKGIGKEIALRAAAEGANVVINYLSDIKAANALVMQLGHDRALAVRADTSNINEVDSLIEATVSRFGRIDILIPNAAYVPDRTLQNVSEEDFDRAFAVNVKGPCFLVQRALPHMTSGGTIIFISTDMTDASTVMPQFLLYVSTKAALNQMVKVLARDLAATGIRVNAVSPGATSTESFHKAMDENKAKMLASHHPFNRIGRADEIAAAVSLLWRKDSGWITGQVLRVNGGSVV